MKIGKKFLFTFILLLLFSVFTTGAVVNHLYYVTLLDSTNGYSTTLVEQIQINMSTRAREYEDGIFSMVQKWRLFEDYVDNPKSTQYYIRGAVSGIVNTKNTGKSKIQDIYVVGEDETLWYFNYAAQRFQGENQDVMNCLNEMDRGIFQSVSWYTVDSAPDTVYMARNIFDISDLKYLGKVCVGIHKDMFQKQFKTLEQSQSGRLLIANDQDEVLFGDTKDLPSMSALRQAERSSQYGNGLQEINGKNYIFRSDRSEDQKWKVMYLVSESQLLGQARKIKENIIIVCAAAILIAFICVTLIAKELTGEIRRLVSHIQNVKYGEWKKINAPYPKDEIGDITVAYNAMVEDLQVMVDKLAEQKIMTERAQYRALQAEYKELQAMINPHFIYNAMESINASAKLAGEEKIAALCTKLGKLMRAAIDPHGKSIPLLTELEYVKAYLEIQKFIMGDRLEVFFDFADVPENYQVPPLLLQPIVENAIVHGVDGLTDSAVIVIEVSHEEYFDRICMVIRISDNGIGMDEETLKKYTDFTLKEGDERSHFGQ